MFYGVHLLFRSFRSFHTFIHSGKTLFLFNNQGFPGPDTRASDCLGLRINI